ncbi:rod shape-determining protein [Microbulbifer halophilus]|uniref:Rod shape-determining protein n=1 Tax=Microbulbifer halophilus TaxID=453963 RepID=A0ABW5EHR4_9GAMM|nr:rod shape-determining protein [Microbulbifer halophilus]MCW8127350.1 rod shape-determining protein [Microbulbifer halophilus]
MIRKTFNKLGARLYVQIWEKRIRATDIDSGRIFDESPLLAIEKKGRRETVVAVGNRASSVPGGDTRVVNPFSHPRSLLRDFAAAEKLLQHTFRELLGNTLLAPSPLVVLHPMEKTLGGLTDIEIRAFRELGLGAGARESLVYEGEELTRHTFDLQKVRDQSEADGTATAEKGGGIAQWVLLAIWILLIAAMAIFGQP